MKWILIIILYIAALVKRAQEDDNDAFAELYVPDIPTAVPVRKELSAR